MTRSNPPDVPISPQLWEMLIDRLDAIEKHQEKIASNQICGEHTRALAALEVRQEDTEDRVEKLISWTIKGGILLIIVAVLVLGAEKVISLI